MRTPHELLAPLAAACVGREHTLAITRAGGVEEGSTATSGGGGGGDAVLLAGGGGGGFEKARRAPAALQPLAGLLYRGFDEAA